MASIARPKPGCAAYSRANRKTKARSSPRPIPSSWESLRTLILPALTLGLIGVAFISFMQRAIMLEVSRSDFIRTARAMGLSERRVVWVHGFKNAVIPVITLIGIDLGTLIGGTFIIEIVFNRPASVNWSSARSPIATRR